ncbi:MAG: TAT-variant-translocated molybdopterin oxidoreductase [Bryobacteraceae bacterium]|nr:TAT-variant-translocated molybdopterin oxidoreductase [Bryobacteraceae bacterium]
MSDTRYWRSLEDLAQTEEFRRAVEDEFPGRSPDWLEPVKRRDLLRLMGASMGLAGLTGCVSIQPQEKIVPYVRQPEDLVPGRPLFFATSMPMCGYGLGLLAESHEGRPTKVEGNHLHPSSLGATDAFAQASVLSLYDPDRSQAVMYRGQISEWPRFLGAMAGIRKQLLARGGAGLRILTEANSSPTFAWQMGFLLKDYPQMKWHIWEPAGSDGAFRASQAMFGRPLHPIYNIAAADVIFSLDADFLSSGPASVRYQREFADRRRVTDGQNNINRLYVAEPTLTPTGSKADHRLPIRASDIDSLARALAAAVGFASAPASTGDDARDSMVRAVAADLKAHAGRSLVIAGDGQPAPVHALAHAMNQALGNLGRTVQLTEPVQNAPQDVVQSLGDLVAAMRGGQVEALVIAGANPVYTAPANLSFADAMARVPFRAHLGLYQDETARLCHWHVPQAHYLEAWSDVRAHDGTASIIQPLIQPIWGGKSIHEFVTALTDFPDQRGYELVRNYWQTQRGGTGFEQFWRLAVHDGVVPDTAAAPLRVSANLAAIPPPESQSLPADQLELVFQPDPAVFDGRFANNAWLQEMPKYITKLTWDNAAYLSPRTAARLGLQSEDLVELTYQGRSVRAPVLIAPGQADNSVTVTLGYGRTRGGHIAQGVGFNAYALRTFERPGFGGGLQVRKVGRYPLALTQNHHALERAELVKRATLEHYREHPDFARHEHHPAFSIYPEYDYSKSYRWGMSIDQSVCTGCSACVLACVAENNVSVVGKPEVIRGREMHWLRIDTYFTGTPDNPEVVHQPMLCQHCEKAPCEPVCPVAATVHDSDGLSQMVYNRCVGTRYCSNNCPYKVRRFNFLLYADWDTESLYALRNPDVTVRSRGVMEKCSFCVQRIQRAKIDAELADRRVTDGEVVTACQAACPTRAIVFGDLNDPKSELMRLRRQPTSYGVLTELNTQPRIGYQAVITNPNKELVKA